MLPKKSKKKINAINNLAHISPDEDDEIVKMLAHLDDKKKREENARIAELKEKKRLVMEAEAKRLAEEEEEKAARILAEKISKGYDPYYDKEVTSEDYDESNEKLWGFIALGKPKKRTKMLTLMKPMIHSYIPAVGETIDRFIKLPYPKPWTNKTNYLGLKVLDELTSNYIHKSDSLLNKTCTVQ